MDDGSCGMLLRENVKETGVSCYVRKEILLWVRMERKMSMISEETKMI